MIHLERLHRRTQPRATVVRTGYREYMARRSLALERQGQIARKERAEFDAKMERYRQIRDNVNHDQANITRQDPHGGRLLKKKMHTVQALGRRFERERAGDILPMPEWEEAIFAAFDGRTAVIPRGKTILRLDLAAPTHRWRANSG